MKKSIYALLSFTIFAANAQENTSLPEYQAPKSYTCYQPVDSVVCDGKLNEQSWQKAVWTDAFIDIEGTTKPKPYAETKVKMLWDEKYLYIAAELEEKHIWGTLEKRDAIIFYDNDFEVFIDPDGDTHNYLEIEVNALNTIFDLMLAKPYRNGGPMIIDWNLDKLQSAVAVNGTLNNPSDTDKKWTVEMAIPVKALCFHHKKNFPKPGDYWRINFSRVQWDTDVVKGKYVKKKDVKEHNWVWSPQGLINMHYPEMWGFLSLSGKKVGEEQEEFSVPEYEKTKWVLRQIYYRQKEHFKTYKKYTSQLSDLKLNELKLRNTTYVFDIMASKTSFEMTIPSADKKWLWHINHESRTWKTKMNE